MNEVQLSFAFNETESFLLCLCDYAVISFVFTNTINYAVIHYDTVEMDNNHDT